MAGLQILQQPRPCRLAEGDPLVLECRALGNPPPQYQWFRNRRPVEGARAPQLQVLQTPCLALRGTARHGVGQQSTVWGSRARRGAVWLPQLSIPRRCSW